MKTASDLELSLLIKENTIQNLKLTNMHLQIKNNKLETKILEAIDYIKTFDEYIGYDDKLYLLKLLEEGEEDEI